jgi:hypothetical protein
MRGEIVGWIHVAHNMDRVDVLRTQKCTEHFLASGSTISFSTKTVTWSCFFFNYT